MSFDVSKIRQDFPILRPKAGAKPIIYFDNACMAMKPVQVVQAMGRYYNEFPACAGRSHHRLGKKATEEYEKAREQIAKFIGAKAKETIFTRNTTEGINLVANSLGLKAGDVVLTTDKEHNSNLLPWQVAAKKIGIRHVIVPSKPDNTLDMSAFEKTLSDFSPSLISLVHTSNLDGVTIPAQDIIKKAHKAGALVLLDAAQSVPHKEIDAGKLGVDFLAFSGHKMLGPTGTGVLYGKSDLLEKMQQFMVGGETVINSTYTSFEPEKPPAKFEAGLQDYAGFIGLAAAAEYLKKIGLKNIEKHETELNKIITEGISDISGLSIIGPAQPELRGGIISFNISGMDHHDIAFMLDHTAGIAIRSGQHCVHSWFNAHGIKGSARASLYLYNTEGEARTFVDSLKKVSRLK